jgi:hypothetical protein
MKLTLVGMSVVLIIVIMLSLYVNEGFTTNVVPTTINENDIVKCLSGVKNGANGDIYKYSKSNNSDKPALHWLGLRSAPPTVNVKEVKDCSTFPFGGYTQAVKPVEVSVSDVGYNAMELHQKSSLLKDIQKMIRNELLLQRRTMPMYDTMNNSMNNSIKSAKEEKSQSIAQGKEYENSSQKDKNNQECNNLKEDNCPPNAHCPDMSEFIKKKEIPCWGCSLDY